VSPAAMMISDMSMVFDVPSVIAVSFTVFGLLRLM
jgi:hypothetical protein